MLPAAPEGCTASALRWGGLPGSTWGSGVSTVRGYISDWLQREGGTIPCRRRWPRSKGRPEPPPRQAPWVRPRRPVATLGAGPPSRAQGGRYGLDHRWDDREPAHVLRV